MRPVGIVCEYNPFHSGHKRQIDELKQQGYSPVICVMSGNFTQRAEPAILPLYDRAAMAVACGADLVVELPFPYASSVADTFAGAAVSILSRLSVDTLSFGSESGDIESLRRIAKVTASEAFENAFLTLSRQNPALGSAVLYAKALESVAQISYPTGSNDILGIAYLRAILRQDLAMEPVILRRTGNAYGDTALRDGYPSAAALRKAVFEGKTAKELEGYLHHGTLPYFETAKSDGFFPVGLDRLLPIAHAYFRVSSPEALEAYAELSGGLAHRICRIARETADGAEFYARLSTPKYTDAHIRRALLFALTRVTKDDLDTIPQVTRLLAANALGCAYLSQHRRELSGFLITKPADMETVTSARRTSELSHAADALYTLLLPHPRPAGAFFAYTPRIFSK